MGNTENSRCSIHLPGDRFHRLSHGSCERDDNHAEDVVAERFLSAVRVLGADNKQCCNPEPQQQKLHDLPQRSLQKTQSLRELQRHVVPPPQQRHELHRQEHLLVPRREALPESLLQDQRGNNPQSFEIPPQKPQGQDLLQAVLSAKPSDNVEKGEQY